jgi:hypothetical protein
MQKRASPLNGSHFLPAPTHEDVKKNSLMEK